MVTMDEAKTELQNAIDVIDGYVDAILQDLIKYRLNRVQASKLILEKLRTKYLNSWSLSYAQKQIHKMKVALAKGSITSAEALPPSLKFNYNGEVGGYSTLTHESGTIDVPQIDVFVFEPPVVDDFLHSFSKQVFQDVLLVRFPLAAEVDEPPDYENAFGKYYRLQFSSEDITGGELTAYDGKAIVFSGVTLILHTFKSKVLQTFRRLLNIGGTDYYFQCMISRGKYEVEVYAPTGSSYTSTIDAVWIHFSTDYQEDFVWYSMGREFGRGTQQDSLWIKDILVVIWNGTPQVFELN